MQLQIVGGMVTDKLMIYFTISRPGLEFLVSYLHVYMLSLWIWTIRMLINQHLMRVYEKKFRRATVGILSNSRRALVDTQSAGQSTVLTRDIVFRSNFNLLAKVGMGLYQTQIPTGRKGEVFYLIFRGFENIFRGLTIMHKILFLFC